MDKQNRFYHYHYHFGDRYDGWRVRKVDAVFRVIPYFLRTRIDAQNFFEERINVDNLEKFIRENRAQMPDLSIMHIIMAALVRLVSQRPKLNRFVIWNKIFARNHLNFSLVIKRSKTDDGEETLIKPVFDLTDTLQDVVRKVQAELNDNRFEGQRNGSDRLSRLMGYMPDFLLRTAVFLFSWMDRVGIMPKNIAKASPWHCSIFLTNLGSIGIESIYHHLYEFGTCSMFVAMGKKSAHNFYDQEGKLSSRRTIKLKFVLDERICDGFYYAASMRMLSKIFADPTQLLSPPERVVPDDGVGKKLWRV